VGISKVTVGALALPSLRDLMIKVLVELALDSGFERTLDLGQEGERLLPIQNC
jgi:hypothetical protein